MVNWKYGEVRERLNRAVSKTVEPLRVPWVRIPPSPPESLTVESPVILTIGHSTHSIDEFLQMLAAHGVEQLIDVRTIQKSRRNPQFHQEDLAASLERSHIGYRHMPGLGGLRRARKDSINTGWKNASFRGYADYMQTPGFGESLRQLINNAEGRRTVIMCAEAVPW